MFKMPEYTKYEGRKKVLTINAVTGILHLTLRLTAQVLRMNAYDVVERAHTSPYPPTIKPRFDYIRGGSNQIGSIKLPLNYTCDQDLTNSSFSNVDRSFSLI